MKMTQDILRLFQRYGAFLKKAAHNRHTFLLFLVLWHTQDKGKTPSVTGLGWCARRDSNSWPSDP